MPGMEAFAVGYLILFIAVPIALISLFIGIVVWASRSRGGDEEESRSASSNQEDEA